MKSNRLDQSLFLSTALIVTGILTLLVVWTGILPVIRPVLVFVFLFLGPGLAFVRLLPAEDIITRITLSVALSLGIDAVVATILLYAHAWSYQNILLIIVVITLIGSILKLSRSSENETIREEPQ